MYLFKAFLFTSFISSAYCEATIQGTITTKNGHEYYVATYRTGAKPMTTDSSRIMEDKPMPTLVYNCAVIPFICNNVETHPKYGGTNSKIFVYDPDADRKTVRGLVACPKYWSQGQLKKGRPIIVPDNSKPALYNKVPSCPDAPAKKLMAAGHTLPKGSWWSCDEFPFRSVIEGGSDAQAVCAPHRWATIIRQKALRAMFAAIAPSEDAEQDIQAALHVHLGRNPTAEGETKAYYTDGNMHRFSLSLMTDSATLSWGRLIYAKFVTETVVIPSGQSNAGVVTVTKTSTTTGHISNRGRLDKRQLEAETTTTHDLRESHSHPTTTNGINSGRGSSGIDRHGITEDPLRPTASPGGAKEPASESHRRHSSIPPVNSHQSGVGSDAMSASRRTKGKPAATDKRTNTNISHTKQASTTHKLSTRKHSISDKVATRDESVTWKHSTGKHSTGKHSTAKHSTGKHSTRHNSIGHTSPTTKKSTSDDPAAPDRPTTTNKSLFSTHKHTTSKQPATTGNQSIPPKPSDRDSSIRSQSSANSISPPIVTSSKLPSHIPGVFPSLPGFSNGGESPTTTKSSVKSAKHPSVTSVISSSQRRPGFFPTIPSISHTRGSLIKSKSSTKSTKHRIVTSEKTSHIAGFIPTSTQPGGERAIQTVTITQPGQKPTTSHVTVIGYYSTKTIKLSASKVSAITTTLRDGDRDHKFILPVWPVHKGSHGCVFFLFCGIIKLPHPPFPPIPITKIIPPFPDLPTIRIGVDGNPTPEPKAAPPPTDKKPTTTKTSSTSKSSKSSSRKTVTATQTLDVTIVTASFGKGDGEISFELSYDEAWDVHGVGDDESDDSPTTLETKTRSNPKSSAKPTPSKKPTSASKSTAESHRKSKPTASKPTTKPHSSIKPTATHKPTSKTGSKSKSTATQKPTTKSSSKSKHTATLKPTTKTSHKAKPTTTPNHPGSGSLPTPVCAGTPSNLPSFNHTFGVDNIMKYCKYITQEGWVVNSTKGAYAPVGYYASETNATVWITLSWNPKCTSGGMYKVNKDDCEVYMGLILDGCNTNSRDKKWGGQLDAKCALWDITTRKGHDDRPPKGFRSVNKRSGWRGVLNRVVGDFFGA